MEVVLRSKGCVVEGSGGMGINWNLIGKSKSSLRRENPLSDTGVIGVRTLLQFCTTWCILMYLFGIRTP